MIDQEYRFSLSHLMKRMTNESYDAVYLLQHYLNTKSKVKQQLYKKALIHKYNIFIHHDAKVGKNLRLPHPSGIVIGKGAEIGDNVTLYQQVTIGGKNVGDTKAGRIASIEDNTVVFAGAKILGRVAIGKNAQIGANAVVLKNVEENSVYVGVPARRIK